jgi:hypothetical protein
MTSSYQKNKKAILKYQKNNPYYREYKRIYEAKYREENKILWNLKSWKATQRKKGKRITPEKEMLYLMYRLAGENVHV